ncbi:hypothetical protein PU02_0337 [Bartonella ancashensis]|uniref:Uncharacterized protein n=1 Tax=Bartonella ancashensis TaxID=1318743 RepID=A0A0M3T2N4_9HYPH|nr:hypothetical protein PU02_0337 [Bartonella ancashensis]
MGQFALLNNAFRRLITHGIKEAFVFQFFFLVFFIFDA